MIKESKKDIEKKVRTSRNNEESKKILKRRIEQLGIKTE